MDALKARLAGERETPRPVRLASYSTFTTYFLGRFLKEEMPGAAFHVRQAVPGEIEVLVADRAVDIGLTYAPMPSPKVQYVRAATTRMAVYARRGAFAGVPVEEIPMVSSLTDISGSPLAATKGFDGWPLGFYDRLIRYEIEGLDAALAACRQGLCAGYFPSFLIHLHNAEVAPALALRPVTLPAAYKAQQLPIYLVRRRNDGEDPVARKLARSLKQACRVEDGKAR